MHVRSETAHSQISGELESDTRLNAKSVKGEISISLSFQKYV